MVLKDVLDNFLDPHPKSLPRRESESRMRLGFHPEAEHVGGGLALAGPGRGRWRR